MAKDGLSHILGRLQTQILADFPHHIFPCPNLHRHEVLEVEEELNQEKSSLTQATHYFKPFPYVSSLPVPILEPMAVTVQAQNGCDPALNLIRSKMKWEKKKARITSANLRDRKRFDESSFRNVRKIKQDTVMTLPRGVATLASHLAEDPGPSFSGTYNWYFGGGSLAGLSYGDKTFLLSSTGSMSEDALKLTSLAKEKHRWKSRTTQTVSITENSSPIHQVLATQGYIAVRQKKQVTLFRPEESENEVGLCLKQLHRATIDDSKESTYVSASVSPGSDLEYCTLSTSGLVRLWQPRAEKKYIAEVKVGRENVPVDNWGSIQYHDANTILMLNRSHIYLLDQRTMRKVKSWSHSDLCELCEDLSMCVESGRQEHLKYVGTSHHLLGLDIRFGFSQRWTHMMSVPPYIGCSAPVNDDSELLFLGSQSLHEVVGIVNKYGSGAAKSNSLPLLLPSPMEALHAAQSKAACISPYMDMRCKMSLIGLACLPIHDSPQLFRQNSLGDVFCQALQRNRNGFPNRLISLSDDDFELLKNCENECTKAVELRESICTTNTTNLRKLFRVATNEKAEVREWSEVHPSTPRKINSRKSGTKNWQLSKQFLEGCVDFLASKLLSVWDVDEDEWADLEEDKKEEEDPTQKVRSWLDSSPMKFDTGIPGIEPLEEEGIHTDKETYNKKQEAFSTMKLSMHTNKVNKDKHIKPQGISRLSVDDNISIRSEWTVKRRLSMPLFPVVATRGSAQLTPIVKKSKLHDKQPTDILSEGSVNSLSLPKRKFTKMNSPELKLSKVDVSTKLNTEYDIRSDRSYPLTQKAHDSQMYGNRSPKPGTPFKIRNLSPIMFGSELGSVKAASIVSKREMNIAQVTKLSQDVSSQDMCAGMTPQRFQFDSEFPVTPRLSQKPTAKTQNPQSAKKIFVPGF